ncbi:hypothetical protein J32TS6_18770 [Virgibacillus pantothenticus]|uniref:hypothetical protein n=1 Tax=Virgibacillus TaxID=84406 RepID=UPI000986F7BD|nr:MULTISPECIES: hypothetical protein [Virgibacillus]GIP63322.1 hypothetical protein J32TS6_18770 [Virgibacillus pantothenticus]
MKKTEFIVRRSDNVNSSFEIDTPNVCPYCEQSGSHSLVAASSNSDDRLVSIILECVVCKETFFAKYNIVTDRQKFDHFGKPLKTEIIEVFPHKAASNNLPADIKDIYPDFYEIYIQALEAESHNLNHITGMSYRKSLEFLVKQYLIDRYPEEEDNIREELLGKSIKRIEYPMIQNLAKATSWLGNDETHFTKKHPDYDVSDIKKFIVSLCHLIVAEHVAEETNELLT